MRKVFCVLMAIILAMGYTAVISASGSYISISGSSGKRGSFVDVRINVKGECEELTVVPVYDKEAFLLYEVKDLETLSGAHHGKNRETGKYQLTWENGGNADGTVAILTFLITESAEIKSYDISATAEGFEVTGGYIGVTEEAPGDVTEDGILDEEDIENIRKHSANWSGIFAVTSGDVNGDGSVNLADAVMIARSASGWQGYLIDKAREAIDGILEIEFDEDTGDGN